MKVPCPPPRLLSTFAETLSKTTVGAGETHYSTKGVHISAQVVDGPSLEKYGLMMDSEEDQHEYNVKVMTAALLLQWRGEYNPYSQDLRCVAEQNRLIPPASLFISIGAVSPLFRRQNLLVDHQDVSEAPWTEQTFFSTGGFPLLDEQEVREGTFIRLFDAGLVHCTYGSDSMELFGQINHFIGFTKTQAVVLINILALYRRNRLQSSSTGTKIAHTVHPYKQTIIILSRQCCRFGRFALLEYQSEALETDWTHTFHREQCLVSWGPARDWHCTPDWRDLATEELETEAGG